MYDWCCSAFFAVLILQSHHPSPFVFVIPLFSCPLCRACLAGDDENDGDDGDGDDGDNKYDVDSSMEQSEGKPNESVLVENVIENEAYGYAFGKAGPTAEDLALLRDALPEDGRKEIETNFLRSLSKRPTLDEGDEEEEEEFA